MATTKASTLTAYTVVDQDISRTADIREQCMRHCYKATTDFGQDLGSTPVSHSKVVYVADGVATVTGFHCHLWVAGTVTSITFDLQKNGVSILSGVVTVTNATGNKVEVDGTIASPTLAAGDKLSVVMVVTTSTGAQGAFARVSIVETGPAA